MKHYHTPKLVAKGDVVELTQGMDAGFADGGGTQLLFPSGSIGFNL